MALSAKVAANTVVQVTSKVISTALSLVAVAVITRYLGNYGFGEYTTAITFASIFTIAGDLGLTMVTTQLISRPGANVNRMMSNLFTFRLVSAAIITALGPLLVLFFPYSAEVKEGVFVASIAFFFILLCQVFVSLFQRELRTDKIALAEVGSRVLLAAGSIAAVSLGWSIAGILWVMAAANGINFLFHYLFARPYATTGFAYDRAVWRDIMKRSWPLVLTIILNLVYLKTDTLLLSLLKGPADVGLYGAAYKVIDVLVTIPFILGGTVLPIMVARWQKSDKADFNRMWQRIFDGSFMIAAPMVVGGWVLAGPIMALVAGNEFIAAGAILRILIFAVGFIFFSSFFSYTMISFDRQKLMIGAYLLTAATALVLYLVFIPRYSYTAAAFITVYSEVLITLLAWRLVRRTGGISIDWRVPAKLLVAAVAMGAVVYALPIDAATLPGIISKIAIGVVIYGALVFSSGAITRAELIQMIRRSTSA